MLTNRAKVTLGVVAGVLVAGGLTANQYGLEKQISQIENKPAMTIIKEEIVTPTASPTAALKVFLPAKQVSPVIIKK